MNKWEKWASGEQYEAGFCRDPITIAVVASTAFQAIGAIQQGQAAKAEADYNARISEQNAEISRQQTKAQLDTQDRERRLRAGSAIAAAGASGTGIESFGDVLSSSAMQEELDLLTLKSEGLLRERDYTNQASLLKAKGKNAQRQGYMQAASAILGGGTKLMGGGSGGMKPKETIDWRQGGTSRYY